MHMRVKVIIGANTSKHLDCAEHCSKCFTYIKKFIPYKRVMKYISQGTFNCPILSLKVLC